jgi:RNA recognition motif-containing protein
MNIFVGNMSFKTTEAELRQLFEGYGAVDKVSVITDRETGRPRGFAFVEMANQAEGQAAIAALNGKEVEGRALTVNEARAREDRGGGGFRGGRGGGGGGGGGRGGRY